MAMIIIPICQVLEDKIIALSDFADLLDSIPERDLPLLGYFLIFMIFISILLLIHMMSKNRFRHASGPVPIRGR